VQVIHAAEINPVRVVLGEHDRFLGCLEQKLEAVLPRLVGGYATARVLR
jgi:hypothetical protein